MEIMCLCGHADCGVTTAHPDVAHGFDSRAETNIHSGPAARL
jgi:hypothetical protein